MSDAVEKLVIIPTYNERENIVPMMDRLMTLPYGLHLLVVDDNSPDGTADLVKERMAKEPRIHVLQRAASVPPHAGAANSGRRDVR